MLLSMKNYTHLTALEREEIFLQLNSGKSYREIGKLLSKSHVAIRKEVLRNEGLNLVSGELQYSPSKAQRMYLERRRYSKKRKLDNELHPIFSTDI